MLKRGCQRPKEINFGKLILNEKPQAGKGLPAARPYHAFVGL